MSTWSVHDSRLFNSNGSVALFGGRTDSSTLNLKVRNSSLDAEGGRHAALVEHWAGTRKTMTLSMNDTSLLAEAERVAH